MSLIRTTCIFLMLELLTLFDPVHSIGDDALMRYRLMRAREAALTFTIMLRNLAAIPSKSF